MVSALEGIKNRVLDRYPYFGSVAAGVHFKESFSIEAFGTDGDVFYCNPKSPERFSEEDLVFLFAHELCHIAFNHIERSRNKNLRLWSKASDAVINALLISDGLTPAPGAVIISDAYYYDTEQLYLRLLEQEPPYRDDKTKKLKKSMESSKSSSDSSSSSSSEQDSKNSASNSKNSKEPERGSNKNKNKQDDQDGGMPAENAEDIQPEDMGKGAHSLWDKSAAKETDREDDEQPEETADDKDEEISLTDERRVYREQKVKRKQQMADLEETLSNQATGSGKTSNSDKRQVSGIGDSVPLVDWRRTLREEITYDVWWSYKNAVIENGVLTPYLEEMPYPVTEILLDTSGSIEVSLLKSFLRECKGILQSSQIRVGCFDVIFYGFHDIRKETDIDEMSYKGGGGTDFNAAVNAFSRRVKNKIIFTDGDAEMPDTPMDAIWLVFGDKDIIPRGGRVIRIAPEQLSELMARQQ